jgi:hypothetical protein
VELVSVVWAIVLLKTPAAEHFVFVSGSMTLLGISLCCVFLHNTINEMQTTDTTSVKGAPHHNVNSTTSDHE